MALNVILVRIIAMGFIAQCLVCTRWCYVKLPWRELERADELKCPVCNGSCDPNLDSVAMEYEVEHQVEP